MEPGAVDLAARVAEGLGEAIAVVVLGGMGSYEGTAIGSIMVGLAVAVVGFLLSARFGLEHYADPAVPLSPVIFIVGVVMSFYSAAVYVIVPPG